MAPLKINLLSLGCSKNTVDTEQLMFQLKKNHVAVSFESSGKPYDVVIINTCGFIGDAKEESINEILKQVEYKIQGDVRKIIVFGCLAQRYKNELEIEIPEVDLFIGTDKIPQILSFLGLKYFGNDLAKRMLSSSKNYAYVKISEGCNRKCTFCAIPIMRGTYKSKPVESIVAEVKYLASMGVKEILLIAQDLSFYGIDLYAKSQLKTLIGKLSAIEGIEWIRLHYAFPEGFPLEVIDYMRDNPKICKYLDMPFQHISDRILKKMNRKVTSEQSYRLIQTIRDKVPGICLRTSIMVGFPGETMNDFNQLMQFISDIKFERLGVFKYSHEEGTIAFKSLKDNISDKLKEKRMEILMNQQYEISLRHNLKMVGNTFKVMVDRFENNMFIGRTEFDSPGIDNEVQIISKGLIIGRFYPVTILSADPYSLKGHVIQLNHE